MPYSQPPPWIQNITAAFVACGGGERIALHCAFNSSTAEIGASLCVSHCAYVSGGPYVEVETVLALRERERARLRLCVSRWVDAKASGRTWMQELANATVCLMPDHA